MAERHPREQALRRVHGTGALFAAAYGNVGSSIYYALGVVAAFALGLTPVTFLIAGLIFACTAATYVEATVMYPEAGGSSSFARHAFNELVSFVAGWGQMLNYVITVAISAFFVPHYLAVFWDPLGHGPGDIIAGVVVIALLAALNVKGTRESARFNLVLAIADLLTQVVLVAIGIALVLDPDILIENVHLGVAPTWGDAALGVAVGMIAYTGIETISNMSEEARDASRTVPRGTGLTVLAVLGLYALLPIVALSAMPVTQDAAGNFTTELGTKYADDPVLGIVENLGLSAGLTDGLRVYVGVLAAVILLIATNAALIGLSRLTFSMGQYRQLPERLRQVHPRFKTPYVAIIVFSGGRGADDPARPARLPRDACTRSARCCRSRSRIWRWCDCEAASPSTSGPGSRRLNVRIRGVEVPLTALLGGLGTFAAWIVVMALNVSTLIAGSRLDGDRAQPCTCSIAATRGCRCAETVKVQTPGAAGGAGGRVQQRARRLRGRALRRGDRGHGRGAGVKAPAGDARALAGRGAQGPAARRRPGRRGERGSEQDRAREADLRPARQRRGGARAARCGRRRRSSSERRRSTPPRSSCSFAIETGSRSTARRCRPCSPSGRAG